MKPIPPILLVEDDDVDASTIIQSLHDLKVKNPIVHKTDGEQALEYLNDPAAQTPSLVFLDLNMPKIDGVELLRIIKADTKLKEIPVVVMTVSQYERDKLDTFNLGVVGYIIKPVDYDVFLQSMDTVIRYWSMNDCVEQEREAQDAKL